MDFAVRAGASADFSAVVAIQEASAELSAWTPEALACVLEGRSDYRLLVAESGAKTVGFVLWRELPADETEVLSIAVAHEFRRRGVARALLQETLADRPGACFLEVRESNLAAQRLYRTFGFEPCGLRSAYYHRPVEDAVVMRRPAIVPKGAAQTR